MTSLNDFDPDEQELLVSLPYKAGIWVSHAEDEIGEEDDEKEMMALEASLKALPELHQDCTFICDLVHETLNRRDQWGNWMFDSVQTPQQMRAAIDMLKNKLSKDDLNHFRSAMMEVGASVAQAYGEFGDFDDETKSGFGGFVTKIMGGFAGGSASKDHPMNISAAEDSALEKLKVAMRIKE